MKKFLGKLGWLLGGIITACLCLLSILMGFGSVIEIAVKVISIAGGGSLIRGIIMAPFFVFGVIQIVRGFMDALDRPIPYYYSKKTGKRYDMSTWYFLAMIGGYGAVFAAIYFWAQSQVS